MAKIIVRARAVDMLGRQQIAGIPTAIHELFKNAHDAYATRVEADYYRNSRILWLRDNGYGMTKQDLEEKWLALGTESKVGSNLVEDAWPTIMGLPRRTMTGEKGIGRLAIAVIGPVVVVLSRAKRAEGLQRLVASLVHWGVFEIPGLNLDRIDIPTVALDPTDGVNETCIQDLSALARQNLAKIRSEIPVATFERIDKDLSFQAFSPNRFWQREGELTLAGEGHGTHFFILSVSPLLENDIEGDPNDEVAPPLKKELLGFSNTMLPSGEKPPIVAEMRDFRKDGQVVQLIGRDEFFTPEEFQSADHHFSGEFDKYGTFKGTVSIYDTGAVLYERVWDAASGETECGPFKIDIAYVQGLASDSAMPQDEWARMTNKMNLIGGLYIYRDGIRVLPYGNTDYDFLRIETRRNKSQKDFFFAYRRMVGVIQITHKQNAALEDKAGREGFRANKAYRQFRSILESFLQQLARDFFRPEAELGYNYRKRDEELKKRHQALKRREALATERKRSFTENLGKFFRAYEEGNFAEELTQIDTRFSEHLNGIRAMDDRHEAGLALLQAETEALDSVRRIETDLTISRPRGVTLNKGLLQDWTTYQQLSSKLLAEKVRPFADAIREKVTALRRENNIRVDRRLAIRRRFTKKRQDSETERRKIRNETDGLRFQLNEEVDIFLHKEVSDFTGQLNQVHEELNAVDLEMLPEQQYEAFQDRLMNRLDVIRTASVERLEMLRAQLEAVTEAVHDGSSIVEFADAASDQAAELQVQLDKYVEYAQAGMSIGIIEHEFAQTVNQLRTAISQLTPWAKSTPRLAPIKETLRTSLEHLDGYLNLFTPLSRRLHRSKTLLSGSQIAKYVEAVFEARFLRHGISFQVTSAFNNFQIECHASSFLPVFLNLVDNAIYWISNTSGSEKWIKFDSVQGDMLVANGGPGIAPRIADRIFEIGESFRYDDSGRGMGLYISRRSLEPEGWELTLDEAELETHPVFRISPLDHEQ